MLGYIKNIKLLLLFLIFFWYCQPREKDSIVGLWIENSRIMLFEGDTIIVQIPLAKGSKKNNEKKLNSYLDFKQDGTLNQLSDLRQILFTTNYIVKNDTLKRGEKRSPIIRLDTKNLVIEESTTFGGKVVISYQKVK